MPRSLKLPVGFMPSNLRCVSTPMRSDSRGAWISGVEPSISDTTGVSGLERQAVAVALDQRDSFSNRGARHDTNSSSITRMERGGARSSSSFEIASSALRKRPSGDPVHHHHEPRVLADALLHDALHAHAVVTQHLRDLGQHAGAVLDLEVEVERRLDLLLGEEARLLDRVQLHARRAHHRHDVAEHGGRGLRPAGARTGERHLGDRLGLERDGIEGADHRRERVAAVQEGRGTRARSTPPSRRSATPSSFRTSPNSLA